MPLRLLLGLLALAVGCGSEPETPEARVRALLARAEAAAEARDVAALAECISERYADEESRSWPCWCCSAAA